MTPAQARAEVEAAAGDYAALMAKYLPAGAQASVQARQASAPVPARERARTASARPRTVPARSPTVKPPSKTVAPTVRATVETPAPTAPAAVATPAPTGLDYYLGVHRPSWLGEITQVPLFVSHRTLCDRRELPRATTRWALDSGGFTELSLHGRWETTPKDYVAAVRRYVSEIGQLDWASQQDWMCEPAMLKRTGLTVEEHQKRTINNYFELRSLAPELPWVPVLQGWSLGDYWRHVEAYESRGVWLNDLPRVGVGSVCRRQSTVRVHALFGALAYGGMRLHGFGLKLQGLRSSGGFLHSADSMAWSFAARQEKLRTRWSDTERKTGQQNDRDEALRWYQEHIANMQARGFCPETGMLRDATH